MAAPKQSIVVGVDGSEESFRAAKWAAAEASHRHSPLCVVLVNDDPARTEYAEKTVRETAERCHEWSSELEVTDEVVFGHPVDELVRRSADAQLVVLGSRGHGGFADALLGSVSTAVAVHGSCPVVVLRGTATATGPVVVGVDESSAGRAALRFAFETASRRAADLVAVQALPDAYYIPGPFPHPDRDELQRQADLQLTEQLAGFSETYPGVHVRRITTNEHPVAALREVGQGAQLVVVGHRGRGGFEGLLLGSVATGVLHHSPCPVAVVRTAS